MVDVLKYAPADEQDCSVDEFAVRMAACEACEHRLGSTCRLVNLLVSVNARRRASTCHAHAWPEVASGGCEPPNPSALKARKTDQITTRNDQGAHPPRSPCRNVVVVCPWAGTPGGSTRWMISLARYLPRVNPGFRVSAVVVTNAAAADRAAIVELNEATQCIVGEGYDTRRAVAEADIVIQWGLGELENLLRGFTGPRIFLAHGACSQTIQCIVSAATKGGITHWAAVSESARGVFPESLVRGVEVIPNGIEVERCVPIAGREAMRAAWGLQPDQIAVGYIGRFDPDKRPKALAEAVQYLPENFVGVMIGKAQVGSIQAECERICAKRIKFVGPVNMVGDALAGLDLWFNASKSEGSCLSRLEAAFAGLPCISTPVGDLITDEAQHGPLSFRFAINATPREMAGTIHRAWLETELRAKITERARCVAWESGTAPAMAHRWAEWLGKVVGCQL